MSALDLVASLRTQGQRRELTEIAERLGARLAFLKSAWADPVLYGGRGERRGHDIDVLVPPRLFAAFSEALRAQGYRAREVAERHATVATSHERLFYPPDLGLPIDLHRGVANPAWFDLPAEDLLRRACLYPSIDGPIRSLAPEDQLLYAAVHYANHGLDLDARHLEDCRRLIAVHAIDSRLLGWRAERAGADLALSWLWGRLAPGEPSPTSARRRFARWRRRGAEALAAHRPGKPGWRQVAALSLLSTRSGAGARFAFKWASLRLADRRAPSSSLAP